MDSHTEFQMLSATPVLHGFLCGVLYDFHGTAEECAKKEGQIQDGYPDALVAEMKNMLKKKELPVWEALSHYALVNSEQEARDWLQKMIDIIEANRPPKFRKKS